MILVPASLSLILLTTPQSPATKAAQLLQPSEPHVAEYYLDSKRKLVRRPPQGAPGTIEAGLSSAKIIYNHSGTDSSLYGALPNLGARFLCGVTQPHLLGPPTDLVVDEGRIPGVLDGGSANAYRVTAFSFGYGTGSISTDWGGAGVDISLSFWSAGAPCASLTTLGPPTATFDFLGLPGVDEPAPCDPNDPNYHEFWWIFVTLDPAMQFQLAANANGVFGDGDSDLFSWSFEWLNDEEGGPMLYTLGDLGYGCYEGAGTFGDDYGCGYGTGGVPLGWGLGTLDEFWELNEATDPEDCFWFGGGDIFASYRLILWGEPLQSAGTITLDRSLYSCTGTANLEVIDDDLNLEASAVETIPVLVSSDSEIGGETVVLTETTANSGTFRGAIAMTELDEAGKLLVHDGDGITATYVDAFDGQGGAGVVVTDTAVVDCGPPSVVSVAFPIITPYGVRLEVTGDEPITVEVLYGTSCDATTSVAHGTGSAIVQTVDLLGLQPGTRYYVKILATDNAGNLTVANNGGTCFTFETSTRLRFRPALPPVLPSLETRFP